MSVLLELVIGVYILVKLYYILEDQIRGNFLSFLTIAGAIITTIFILITVMKIVFTVIAKMIYPI